MDLKTLPKFAFSDEAKWNDLAGKLSGSNWFGEEIVRFAATWANLMEAELARGKAVAAVAEKTAIDAEKKLDGIADNVYGYAMEILSVTWKHGPQLAAVYA